MSSTACSPASASGNDGTRRSGRARLGEEGRSGAALFLIAALGRDGPDLIGQPLESLLRVRELIGTHLASPARELSNEREQLVEQFPELDVAPPLPRRRRTVGVARAGRRCAHDDQADAAADPASAVISWALARTAHARPRLAMAGSTMRAPRK